MLRPAHRSVLLTVHVILSVGWTGAVATFLALAVVGAIGETPSARAAAIAMDIATRCVIAPLSFLAPATGLILAMATRWGLLKHYWIIFKVVLTLPATAMLMLHMGPIGKIAEASLRDGSMATMRQQMAIDAALALLVLIVVTALAVTKPKGTTRFYR